MAPTDEQDHKLSGRIESFRDISQLEFNYYEDEVVSPPQSPSLKGRESLVSLQTQPTGSPPESSRSGSGRWARPFSTSSRRKYKPVGNPGSESRLSHITGRTGNGQRAHGARHTRPVETGPFEAIHEGRESADIALLSAAAPISRTEGAYPYPSMSMRPAKRSQNSTSPLTPVARPKEVDEQMKRWQEQEQAGQLTGGLGAGFRPATTIKEEQLLSPASPVMKRTMSFSLRNLSRSATVKVLGQNEADRTGQPVRVIIEEPEVGGDQNAPSPIRPRDSKMDLSFVAGDEAPVAMEELRVMARPGTTLSSRKIQRTETFYPQPNWKPFSMRWPYMVSMILLSILLAVFTELLYRHSAKNGLITFISPSDIAGVEYFAIKFLPTIMAVLYGVLWQMTEFEVKRLEPFYQLSKEQGATAAESLNVDYITSVIFLRPLRSLQRRHYAVAISTVASLLAVSAVPTLSSAMIVLTPDRETRLANPGEPKCISINATWSRLLESVLLLTAVLGAALLFQLRRRRSGLLADVKGIAGLAAMANVSHILMDFKDMDVATHKDIHQKLANRRYQLRNSALVPISHADEGDLNVTQVVMGDQPVPPKDLSANFHLSINPHPLMFRGHGALPFIAATVLFLVFLPLFLFTPVGNFTDYAPWAVTLMAVGIKLGWGALDTTTRLMEPFYILYRRHAPPKTLTLDYTAMPFAWVAVRALLNRHYLVFAVGFGTVMTEVLTVLVASLATVEGSSFAPASLSQQQQQQQRRQQQQQNRQSSSPSSSPSGGIDAGEETVHSFWISLAFATAILAYMSLVAGVVYLRRRRPFLPRQPNTIASVLGYIHQSKMLYDFVGAEKRSGDEMRRYLEGGAGGAAGRTYGLGWCDGRDGRIHCAVDREEMSASYRHGIDFRKSNMPWVEDFGGWA